MASNNLSVEALPAPTDGVSSLAWSSQDFLVATSWDCEVRCWQVGGAQGAVPVASSSHQAPVLCSAWEGSGNMVVTGGCDNVVQAWDLGSGATSQVGEHSAPVKEVAYSDELNCVLSASWDSTLKAWDLRSSAPAFDLALPQRAFTMDATFPLVAVGCAERQVVLYDIRKLGVPYKHFHSPLKYQTRKLAVFPDATGFAISSIEGRVAIHYVEEKDSSFNFAFRCHRIDNSIYAVNGISFNKAHGTFVTCGSDGTWAVWDKDSKKRLYQSPVHENSISDVAFSHTGAFIAYAVSFDWHKGAEFYAPATAKNSVCITATSPSMIQPRPQG
ncbi:RNA export 1 [Thecamonas trahens ATCC 50062]|uniref:RNA export 1 n=1 Tax=Thecamonas trahens ATCC 50062 TaxID=461836 RepID=A0A0L0DBQ8_THETB|nr:RNA export 1 [Thecamonas trahens ATCC 50062]KNC49531.1 RNA export 1 [Thecamonas trahens ATCC 50062]|eukprot:XP_013757645.1 RNA export 1 [Thecamonas trahens ATCC 50062]